MPDTRPQASVQQYEQMGKSGLVRKLRNISRAGYLGFHANSRRLNLFERSVNSESFRESGKCGVEFCFFLARSCLGDVFFGKENRKDLQTARPKCAGATEQIKSPHSPEAFAVTIREAGPGAAEVFLPGEQGRVVIRADVLDVFNDENAFRSARQLSDGRKHGVWENVARDPGIGVDARNVSANSLAKKQSILAQRTSGCSHVGAIIFVPNMLDHPHAYHPIKLPGDFAVVAQLDFHVQSATPTLGVIELFL